MNKIKKLLPVLMVFPFIIGAIGYYCGGEAITDSLYASFALYFINPVSDVYNVFVDLARWMAALVTTTAILYVLRNSFNRIFVLAKGFRKDSVAIYADNDKKIQFDKKVPVIYAGKEFVKTAKSHIIMFDSDAESMQFYDRNREILHNKNVFIAVKEIDVFAANTSMGLEKNVQFFDISEATARHLWKTIALWDKSPEGEVNITIVGTGHLGQDILSRGLLVNLYSKTQQINYHIIGENDYYLREHEDLKLFNKDSIDYYEKNSDESWKVICNSNILICADDISVNELLMYENICKKAVGIYYYLQNKKDLKHYTNINKGIAFGDEEALYTDANIRRLELVRSAINQNYSYVKSLNNADISTDKDENSAAWKEWSKLDGFYKWSNISSSDYCEVLKKLKDNRTLNATPTELESVERELAELEHIRWCRFHYINHWKYGKTKNVKEKTHHCLVDFNYLSKEDKMKDIDIIRNI
ncbi:MAG: hypothetical protein IIX45_00020 [Lachnospiraceae bacterium]|nr:hypothetical protein [Lachnospiraceae bacterium]